MIVVERVNLLKEVEYFLLIVNKREIDWQILWYFQLPGLDLISARGVHQFQQTSEFVFVQNPMLMMINRFENLRKYLQEIHVLFELKI